MVISNQELKDSILKKFKNNAGFSIDNFNIAKEEFTDLSEEEKISLGKEFGLTIEEYEFLNNKVPPMQDWTLLETPYYDKSKNLEELVFEVINSDFVSNFDELERKRNPLALEIRRIYNEIIDPKTKNTSSFKDFYNNFKNWDEKSNNFRGNNYLIDVLNENLSLDNFNDIKSKKSLLSKFLEEIIKDNGMNNSDSLLSYGIIYPSFSYNDCIYSFLANKNSNLEPIMEMDAYYKVYSPLMKALKNSKFISNKQKIKNDKRSKKDSKENLNEISLKHTLEQNRNFRIKSYKKLDEIFINHFDIFEKNGNPLALKIRKIYNEIIDPETKNTSSFKDFYRNFKKWDKKSNNFEGNNYLTDVLKENFNFDNFDNVKSKKSMLSKFLEEIIKDNGLNNSDSLLYYGIISPSSLNNDDIYSSLASTNSELDPIMKMDAYFKVYSPLLKALKNIGYIPKAQEINNKEVKINYKDNLTNKFDSKNEEISLDTKQSKGIFSYCKKKIGKLFNYF